LHFEESLQLIAGNFNRVGIAYIIDNIDRSYTR